MNVAILGLGEVGQAVQKLLKKKHKIFVKELQYDQTNGQEIQAAHVCIPYTQKFESHIQSFLKTTKPEFAIIHSTVKPGTTQRLQKLTKTHLAHSPFLGVHNKKASDQFIHKTKKGSQTLYGFFTKFPKIIGPTTQKSLKLSQRHFRGVGLKTLAFDSSLETELAKILCTTYYGWNIIFEKWVAQICQDQKANFKQVYTNYNHIYNQGYSSNFPHVVRPVLQHHNGPIGGHCVVPNAKIIASWIGDDFTKFLIQQDKKLQKLYAKNK